MRKILNHFGIRYQHPESAPYDYNYKDYSGNALTDGELVQAHRDFLKSLEDEEVKRLEVLESKTSQMVSQTGIIFSLLSLFVPLLIEKAEDLALCLKVAFSFLLTLSFVFYILAIRNALKNFDIKNFIYSKPSPGNVLKYQDKPKAEFLAIEVRDLLYSINQNTATNNKKATNLIHSYNSFRAGNLVVAMLVISFCVSFLLFSAGKKKANEVHMIKVESIDSLGPEVIKQLKVNLTQPKPNVTVKGSVATPPRNDSTKHQEGRNTR